MDNIVDRINKISKNKNKELYPKFPRNMLVECSNACNLSCIFCANRKMTRKKGEISEELLKKILLDAYNLGTREVGFYMTGEPLISCNLENYIRYAKKVGYEYIYLTTNGVLANLNRVKYLKDCGLDSLKFSINAINENDYKMIHGSNKYNIVMKNLKDIWEWKNDFNINLKIYVSYISTKYTEYSIKEIESNFKLYCDKVLITNVRNQAGLVPEADRLLKNTNEDNKIQGKRLLPCYYPFNTLCVTKEGYLTACCTDFQNYLAYSDLTKVTLEEAWHSELITKLREEHINNNLKRTLCYNCIYDSVDMPKPLNSKLATEFDRSIFFNDEYVISQIKKYKTNNKQKSG